MKKHREIAPRLADGSCRVSIGHGLPEAIKEGIRGIARRENRSVSWVLEQVVIRYFKLAPPDYIPRKNREEKKVVLRKVS